MSLQKSKTPRTCSVTGRGMWSGYCFNDGEAYAASLRSARVISKRLGYKSLREAYKDGAYYWTEWSEEDIED